MADDGWPGRQRFIELLAARCADAAVLDGTAKAARSRSPLVAALPAEETQRHVRAMIEASLAALITGEIRDEDLHAAERLGEDRALQGVPVAALLDGFQAGRSHIVRMVVDEGRVLGIPADDLLEGITRIDVMATALEHRMVHAHRIAELAQARTAREVHVQLLRQLLHGEPVAAVAPLDPARRYHCVVSNVSAPAVARELEDALSTAASGLYGLVDGRLAALLSRPPSLPGSPGSFGPPRSPDPYKSFDSSGQSGPSGQPDSSGQSGSSGPDESRDRPGALDPAGLAGSAVLLVVSPAVPLAEIPSRYGLCRRALQAAGEYGLTGVRDLTDLALVMSVAAQPDLGRLLSESFLGVLRPGDAFHRELAETALVYLDHGGRVEPAAAALHVHPNTVKYRVRRLQELTGRPLAPGSGSGSGPGSGSAVTHAAHWWWALRGWLNDAKA